MSLDAFVRCAWVRRGKANPPPLPDCLMCDESGDPTSKGNSTETEEESHARDPSEASVATGIPVMF
jgi:hypothetical protein